MSERIPVFVIGTGRCGSTLLSELIARHPELLSLSEVFSVIDDAWRLESANVDGPAFWHLVDYVNSTLREVLEQGGVDEVLSRPQFDAHGKLRPTGALSLISLPHLTSDGDLLASELPAVVRGFAAAPVHVQFQRLFDWLCTRFERRIWIERSGGSIEYVESLRRMWPTAKFIHLIRDGVACAYSMSRHPMFRVRVARVATRNETLDVGRCLSTHVPLDRYGAYWSALMVKTLRFVSSTPETQTLILHHEELLRNPRVVLEKISSFLGLSYSSTSWLSCVERLIRPEGTGYRALSSDELHCLERACRPGQAAVHRLRQRVTQEPAQQCSGLRSSGERGVER